MSQQDDPCTLPRDGDDPLVYSQVLGSAPYSLLLGQPPVAEAPPPTYLSVAFLNKERAVDKDSQFAGYTYYGDGGLLCVDERVIANQRGVILEVIKQVAACLMKGRGLVGMSLPIRLFEPRSTLERMLDRWALLPVFFENISQCDQMTRFKRMMAMAVAGLHVAPSQEKPFNPLLGETLQATWPDGTEIFCEHTVHHPSITNFQLLGNGFKVHGHLELTGKFKKNSLVGAILGVVYIEFADGQRMNYTYPEFKAGGMIFGSRTVNWQKVMTFKDPGNATQAVLTFGPARKKGIFKRAIGKLDDFTGEIEVNGEKVAEITGSWLNNLVVAGEELWNINTHRAVFHQFPVGPLPSDWRYREDMVWLARDNSVVAQKWKHRIENRQRDDRKLRGATH